MKISFIIYFACLFLLVNSAEETKNKCGLKRENFQTTIDGKKTDLFILTNKNGLEIAFTNYGGAISCIMTPDKNKEFANIIQGHDSIQKIIHSPSPYLSTLIGRYANRIKDAKFSIDNIEYRLELNEKQNHLHGGAKGFHTRVWDAQVISPQEVKLTYVSKDGEEGYPGTLTMEVTYSLNDKNEFKISYRGTTDKPTIVNMTHHAFFNLRGLVDDPCSSIEDHFLILNAFMYLPTDENQIPTGEIFNVKKTNFTFLNPTRIGQNINNIDDQLKIGHGYDHCYIVNQHHSKELTYAAKLFEPQTRRSLIIYTTEPGIQIYTANWHDGFKAYHDISLPRRSAIALEPQHFPNSPNTPHFPSVELKPGDTYFQDTVYRFGVDN